MWTLRTAAPSPCLASFPSGKWLRRWMRAIVDPEAAGIDKDKRSCLLGTAVLAIIAGCCIPADDAESSSLEDTVRAITLNSRTESER